MHQWLQVIADGSWISLHYDTPALADASFSEIYGGGYVRQKAACAQPTSRTIWSILPIRFTGLTQGQLTHFGVWDSQTGGLLLAYAALPERVPLLSGQGYVIPDGELAISVG